MAIIFNIIIKKMYSDFREGKNQSWAFVLFFSFCLDPTVRLALFKNNENKVSDTKSPKKAQPQRDGYFEGMI